MDYKINIIKNINFYFDKLNEDNLNKCVDILISNKEKNIFILGIGKSYNTGIQFCDLLRCINFKSIVLEPSKLLHGDIGLISNNDIIICLSNSGNTQELYDITKVIKEYKTNKIYLLSSKENGKIAENCLENFIIPVEEELPNCFKLIPTNSYLNFILYFNQIISILIEKLGINQNVYKENHKSGNISKMYQNILSNIVPSDKCSIINYNSTIKDLILSQNKSGTGCTIVLKDNNIYGFITDKDLRVYLENNNDLNNKIEKITNEEFYFIDKDILIRDINSNYLYIPVIIDGKFLGIYKN